MTRRYTFLNMCKRYLRSSFSLCCLLLAPGRPAVGQTAVSEAAREEIPQDTASRLAFRQKRQSKDALAQMAFHDFRFTDRTAESGITFHSQAVDDVGKYNKPIHYDHGCAIAV